MPKRIQRKRTKGWKMPEGAVYVGRPTRWANPFRVGVYSDSRHECVDMFKWCISEFPVPQERIALWREVGGDVGSLIALAKGRSIPQVDYLTGKDLVCWCAPDAECHADVLLEIANQ
jgi:hypothetical protein